MQETRKLDLVQTQSEFGEMQVVEERLLNTSAKTLIAGSIAKDDDTYSLHETGAGVHLNEPEGVVFMSSRKLQGDLHFERGPHALWKFRPCHC